MDEFGYTFSWSVGLSMDELVLGSDEVQQAERAIHCPVELSGLQEDGATSIDGPDDAAIRAYRCSFSYSPALTEGRVAAVTTSQTGEAG
jgi:hypothetical protein